MTEGERTVAIKARSGPKPLFVMTLKLAESLEDGTNCFQQVFYKNDYERQLNRAEAREIIAGDLPPGATKRTPSGPLEVVSRGPLTNSMWPVGTKILMFSMLFKTPDAAAMWHNRGMRANASQEMQDLYYSTGALGFIEGMMSPNRIIYMHAFPVRTRRSNTFALGV